MTTVGFLSVAPVQNNMSKEIAKAVEALEGFDVSYETTGMGTIIEAQEASTVFEAAASAHEAVDADRVSTFLKIDDKRNIEQASEGKVKAVEEHLGREPKSTEGKDGT